MKNPTPAAAHVNGTPAAEPVRLIVPGEANPDIPAAVILWDSAEGVKIPDPGDVMHWIKAAAYLYGRALNRLAAVAKEHARDDLRHVVSWSVPGTGDEVHCRLQVRVP